jgi:predicted lipoprotein with Yx(FWY)xxD motif
LSDKSSAAEALSQPTPVDVSLVEDGGVYFLRTANGMALYRYDLDKDGKSHCVDACSERWPPLIASAEATSVVGQWKAIPRGAARQWTYKGAPLYTYALDQPGAQAGDGIAGLWHVISP